MQVAFNMSITSYVLEILEISAGRILQRDIARKIVQLIWFVESKGNVPLPVV